MSTYLERNSPLASQLLTLSNKDLSLLSSLHIIFKIPPKAGKILLCFLWVKVGGYAVGGQRDDRATKKTL